MKPSPFPRAAHLGVPPESHEQARLAEFLDLAIGKYGWMHSPNEGKRSGRTGNSLKRQGLKPGFPDVLVFRQGVMRSEKRAVVLSGDLPMHHRFVGIAIELKRQGAPASSLMAEQISWGRALAGQGWYWFAARGADEAIAELMRLGFGS